MSNRQKRQRGRPKKQPLPRLPPPMPREEIDRPPQSPPQPAPAAPAHPQPPADTLTLGDGELHPGRYNMAIVRKAIREGYPVTEAIRQLVVNQMALVVGRSDSEKNKVAAAKVLVAADTQNVKRAELALRSEAFETGQATSGTQVNVQINIEATQQQAELAALAAEIRSGRVVEGLFTKPEAIDSGADGTPSDSSTQGQNGNP